MINLMKNFQILKTPHKTHKTPKTCPHKPVKPAGLGFMIKPRFYANPVRSYTTQRTQMTGDALLYQHLRFITISFTL